MSLVRWEDLTSAALAMADMRRCVAILPLAATEQHGPHLPLGTDSMIAEGLLAEAARQAPEDLPGLVLPVLRVGASEEHAEFPGTLSVPASQLVQTIAQIGAGVARAGLRKLVLVSSHGGNLSAMAIAALELRMAKSMFAVVTSFPRMGLPEDLVDAAEKAVGIHGGLVETSLMLHFRPDLVAMEKAESFASLQSDLAAEHRLLRAYGPVGFGWAAGDLNPAGVTGNAAGASAGIGAAIARHQAREFLALLGEVASFDVERAFGTRRPDEEAK